ncbi:hypothetical protein C8J56DRAFT_911064, partial [Mycena floridula]
MFPGEITLSILELLYSTGWSRDPDYQSLSACSLVHPSWTQPAQSLLYRHITFQQIPLFLQLVAKVERSKGLLAYVRILELEVGSRDDYCSVEDFALLLKACPTLYELTIKLHGIFPLPTEEAVRAAPSRMHLKSLRILECNIQSSLFYDVIQFFPSVQFLTVGVEIAADPPIEPCNLEFYELVLYRTLPPSILRWLLWSSASSLRVLEMRDPASHEDLHILESYHSQLESLRLMRLNAKSASFPLSCYNLKELILLNIPATTSLSQSMAPASTEHLGIINQGYETNCNWNRVLASVNKLPNLRVFSCDKDSSNQPDFHLVESACRDRGVELLYYPTKKWPTHDPVPATHYPRRHSVSNFSVM